MLLSIFAFLVGAAIGRARGGRLRAFTTTTLNKAGWLAAGISGVLIVTLIGPSQPVWWMLAAYGCFAYFGIRNLHFTGMIVLLIGLLMNITPMIANQAVPVSELALISVGEVDESGNPLIEGTRESTATATSFTFFGDVVPVPIFNVVVSLGDLVIAVALADIAMHTMLRAKTRKKDENAFSYKEGAAETDDIDLREVAAMPPAPTPTVKRNGPAHAAGRRPRMRPLTSIHVPAHAAPTNPPAAEAPSSMPPTGIYEPEHATAPAKESSEANQPDIVLPSADEDVIVLNDKAEPAGYLTTTAHLNTTEVDNRPIIDLTTSPTEEQLIEFLRRRTEADRVLVERGGSIEDAPVHRPQRQGRRNRRSNQKVDA